MDQKSHELNPLKWTFNELVFSYAMSYTLDFFYKQLRILPRTRVA